ncbi:unnamed protein product [Moneuplotes crassus]|uniref:Uncharacterized protein n=1 Tax=Euplotes crassus TaxID=5936 RepID=A0AAD1Y4K4_EUPCR|nr:unnamed protein product [Moneuplotes crassus]
MAEASSRENRSDYGRSISEKQAFRLYFHRFLFLTHSITITMRNTTLTYRLRGTKLIYFFIIRYTMEVDHHITRCCLRFITCVLSSLHCHHCSCLSSECHCACEE